MQDFNFTLDSELGVVWIDFVHEGKEPDTTMRYRVNCSKLSSMVLRARFYYIREFPGSKQTEKSDFVSRFSGFYEANQDRIEDLARQVAIAKHKATAQLFSDVRTQLRISSEESAPKMANIRSSI